VLPGFASANWVRQDPAAYWPYESFHFPVDAQTGYAVGWYNLVKKTTDGGANWIAQDMGLGTDYRLLYGVCFPVNAQTGFIVGEAGAGTRNCWKTTNGGTAWDSLSTGGATWTTLYSVCFPVDNQTGYAVGVGGGVNNIKKTTNGGTSWIQQNSGAANLLYSVDFPVDVQTGYAVGAGGRIVKTTNGGTNWTSQSLSVFDLYGVDFLDNQTGYTVGGGGSSTLIFKTTNGGANWNQQSSPVLTALMSVHFPVDAQTGYAVGGGGTILKTTDGGANWGAQTSGVTNYLQTVHFPVDDQTGYAGGGNMAGTGIILKTTDGGGGSGVEEGTERSTLSVQPLKITPNPFASYATVPGHEEEAFSLYDASGRMVRVCRGGRIGEGLAPGVYFLKAANRDSKPLRVVKVR
jgi:photosystem II stability/assembly factor-like uncharacterized protein